MTAHAQDERVARAVAAGNAGTCAACLAVLPLADLEPVPTRPSLSRCRDAVACRGRYFKRAEEAAR